MSRTRHTRPALVASFVALSLLAVAGPVSADTASDLDALRQKAAAAQQAANAAAAELGEAEGRYDELQHRIDAIEAATAQLRDHAARLQEYVRQRAVAAYTRGGQAKFDMVFDAQSPMDAARRTQLLDQANQTDNTAAKKLAALRSDLERYETELNEQRDAQAKVKDQLAARNAEVQQQLVEANRARDQLATRLEQERADAAAAAEAARLRAVQAASRPLTSPTAGQVIANPRGGAFQCPVSGSAYSDSYGPRGDGFHYGIDMMAPTGTPLVAVKAGTVSYVAMAGAGGNEAYLAADDGNVYYYAHQSQFVGGPRRVAQGEVIGLVGSTGRSSAPHLHFEIRLGGANGQRIDPYPTLQSAGC